MRHVRVLTALAALLAILTLLAGGAQAQLPQPDLAVTELTVNDPEPEPGDDVTVAATVENQGDGPSNGFTYNFTLNGKIIDQGSHDGLDAQGDGSSTTIEADEPWTVQAGQHLLQAAVDHNDTQNEVGETNDTNPDNDLKNRTFDIGADLAVTSFEVDPTDTIEGETVTFTAEIENVADPSDIVPDANETFHVEFLVNGNSVAAPTIEGLAAGESATVSGQWTASKGNPSVRAVADLGEVVPDQDRANNEAEPVTLNVRPARPDLVVDDLSYTPDPAEPGSTVTFTASVTNNGHADAGQHDLALLVDNETVDTATLDGVGLNAQENATLTWEATAGTHDVEVLVDSGDGVTETNEDNNVWTLQLPVGSDLLVQDFEVQPPQPKASDRVRFTVEVGNQGLGVDAPFEVAFRVDGETLDSTTLDSLANGQQRNVTSAAWNASVGDHNVSVVLDPSEDIAEVDRSNNAHERQFTVGEPEPDVTVLSAVLDPATVADGDNATVRAQIQNKGARDAGTFTVVSSVDDEQLGQARVEALSAGQRTTLDLGEWTASSGLHELRVQADTDDEVDEASETNNELVRRLGVGANLEAIELSLEPTDPEPGDEVTALFIVQNNGTVATPGVNVSFTQDGSELGNASIDALEPNQQGTAEVTFTATRSGELQARVDTDEDVDEFDEDDNTATASLELAGQAQPPDLTVRSVTLEGEPNNGEEVRFVAEIANDGSGPAPETLVDFRIDGSSIGSPVSVGGLAAGESTEVTSSSWTVTRQEHDLEVRVDPDDRVGETDETNNAQSISVEGGPVGVPLSPILAVVGLVAATLAARGPRGSNRKPP